jgi:glycosyltransferase involved in cell wall biosynthesis
MRTKIESEVVKLGVQNQVILTGYKTYPQKYLALMEIFLLSSFSEGTSMTLLEAMSLGKPCVVTDAGGNKEVIADGENGFVTENDNKQQFSQAINKLITTPSLSKQYSGDSLQRFKAKFDAQVMCNQFARLYK